MNHWDAYLAWNQAISEVLFGDQHRGRPVYLEPDRSLLREVSRRAGAASADPAADLANAVLPTLRLPVESQGVFAEHVRRVAAWRIAEIDDPPPCLGVLLLLSVVAGRMAGEGDLRPNNYYSRLAEVLGIPREQKTRLERDFREETPALWRALNDWLDSGQGARGIPTAHAFDWRRYVSVPISQALMRAEDRKRLPSFFAASRLQPRQQLPAQEMERMLGDWIPGSNVSVSLKRLWPSAKERIADIACVELESWDGVAQSAGSQDDREAQLFLIAELGLRPLLRLRLSLMVREGGQIPLGEYDISSGSSRGAELALEGGSITLGASGLDGWLEIKTATGVAIADVLVSNIVLRSGRDHTFHLSRRCRRLVLFRYSPEASVFYEVSRAELLGEHLLLCHASLAGDLESYLAKVARPGFSIHRSNECPTIPERWVLFRRVQITGQLESAPDDFFPLRPHSLTQVALNGGLALPGRSTWYRDFLPEISAAALEATECALWVEPHYLMESGAEIDELPRLSFDAGATLTLANGSLADGDYRVVLEGVPQGKTKTMRLGSSLLRVRSENSPRGAPPRMIGHRRQENSSWPLTATEGLGESEVIRGASCPVAVLSAPVDAELPTEFQLVASARREDPPSSDVLRPARVEAPDCVQRGYHYFIAPPATSGTKKFKRTLCQCRDCDLEQWFTPSKRRPVEVQATEKASMGRPVVHLSHIESQVGLGNFDTLLGALSYARWGSWSSFHALASQINDHAWFPGEAARILSALGHIDLVVDLETFEVSEWQIAPPTLAVVSEKAAVLCGWRLPTHERRIREDAAVLGGQVEKEKSSFGPTTIWVKGLALEELEEVARSASSSIRDEIRVSQAPGLFLAQALPPILSLVAALPSRSWLSRDLEKFDPTTLRWLRVSEATAPGAYRFSGRPRIYAYTDEEDLWRGRFRTVDYRLAKHLAAREAGNRLMAYDRDSQGLSVPLGAELPGLYERAVVLCSGRPPEVHDDGIVQYANVPRDVASAVFTHVYS